MNSYLRKYGVATTINFELFAVDGIDLYITAADGGTDCNIRKDQAADATCVNDFVDEGIGYSLALTATEMQAAEVTLYIIDAATKLYLDTAMKIETYGDPAAQHAVDLDDIVRGGLTALPNFAAGAAGGLADNTTALGNVGVDWANIENPTTAQNLSGTNIDVDQVVASVSGSVNDVTTKTGYSLSTAGILAIWHQLEAAVVTASTMGLKIKTNLDAAITTAATAVGFATDTKQNTMETTLDAAATAAALTTVQTTVDGIGSAGGASISTDTAGDNYLGGIAGVTVATTKVGTETNGSADTSTLNGTTHKITHAADVLDIVYQFLTGGGTDPVGMVWHGFGTNNDTFNIHCWDHVGIGWEIIGIFTGAGGTTNTAINLSLFSRHRGTSAAELGKVYVRIESASTGCIIDTDQILVEYAVTSRTAGYANGEIWIDVNGVAGSEDYVNGTADNPCASLANAITLATSTGLSRFNTAPGTTITFGETHNSQLWGGHGWDLVLNGQNVDECHFFNAAVSGIATAATEMEFHDCEMSAASIQNCHMYDCTISGTQTITLAGDYHFINCQSGIAGTGAPTIDLGSAVTTTNTVEFRRWSGGITLTEIDSNDTVTISGELGTVTLSGADGTVEIRGTYKAISDSRTGSPVLNLDGAILSADVAAILDDTGTSGVLISDGTAAGQIALTAGSVDTVTTVTNEVTADMTKISGSAPAADNLEQSALAIIPGTVAAGTLTTTGCTTNLTGFLDDDLINRAIVFQSGATDGCGAVITDYNSTGGEVLFSAGIATVPVAGDTFVII